MMKLEHEFTIKHKVINLLFIIWISSLKAREVITSSVEPPCYFNPLCTCSKVVPDLGIVRCQDTLLLRIPQTINSSKVFMLQLNNVGLRSLEPHFLQSTGLYKLSITNNPLNVIPDDAFIGLERTLWRLDLSNNKILNVPSKALRYLQKLRYIDLSGNDISHIYQDSWKGLENSLETLILADNSISNLSPYTFTGLPLLDTINLRGNNLREIDASVFKDGMDKLAHIILADNQLTSIPYLAVSPLKKLKTLDLSYNLINRLDSTIESGNVTIQLDVRISLNELRLDYNHIHVVESMAFQYFNTLNETYLDGNPISELEDNAFQHSKIRALFIRDCDLTMVLPTAFNGLEEYLEKLDLSGNNISYLHEDFLFKFNALRSLTLKDNLIESFSSMEVSNGFQKTLFKLDLSGARNDKVALTNLRGLTNLRHLRLSEISNPFLQMDDFVDIGVDLESLSITFAKLEAIKNQAFKNAHGLKYLDLSENNINKIENEAFFDISHTLLSLKLSHAMSPSMNTFPDQPLKILANLRDLDVSNNKIRIVPDTAFHFLKKLRTVELQDNEIEQIKKGTFQGDIHSHLETIYLSFNKLKSIQQETFSDLSMLEQIHLDDNQITVLERHSFVNMEKLKRLNLKGNKLTAVAYESFLNLPELEDLDMSYNQLTDFQFSVLDLVGTLAMFRVNISHNQLKDLSLSINRNILSESGSDDFHSDIKILDLSYNNITQISRQYFKPLEQSLTHLYLSHNRLLNATNDLFGNMPHLQWLDLSSNRILEFDYDTFKYTKKLQGIFLAHNLIAEIPKALFRSLFNLRLVDLSYNRLRFLPDNLFREEGLEKLDLSHNQLTRLPLSSLSTGAAITLTVLDLSHNSITSVTHGEVFSKLESLSWLDLSHNRLLQVDNGVFGLMPKISTLDLSHNFQLTLDKNGKTFQGIESSLLHLHLENLTMLAVPNLPLTCLSSLSVAHNLIARIPPEITGNLTFLRSLDLSYNKIIAIPVSTQSLTNLKKMVIAGNPVTVLTNTSFNGVYGHLEELDLTDLNLNIFEIETLSKMTNLKSLKVGEYHNVKNFNIPKVIKNNLGVESLEIEVEKDTDLQREMYGELPSKLKKITITGRPMKKLNLDFLQEIKSPYLHFTLKNTSISQVTLNSLTNSQFLRNLSIHLVDNNQLQYFQNPITVLKPGLSSGTFLLELYIRGNRWNCDCGIGWMEVWQRKRRQYLCDSSISVLPPFRSPAYSCRHANDDIRISECPNRNNQSLIEVLKNEIECGWSSGSSNHGFAMTFILIIVGMVQKIFY